MKLDEEVREFLIESSENLANLDREIVLLEGNPKNTALIASVFRTVHTIKGTCGFFEFHTLGAITHIAESILDQVRTGAREWGPVVTSVILETVDAVKALLVTIESEGTEGKNEYLDLRRRLTEVSQGMQRNSAAAEVLDTKLSAIHTPPGSVTPNDEAIADEKELLEPIVKSATVTQIIERTPSIPTAPPIMTLPVALATQTASVPVADPAASEAAFAPEGNALKNSALTDSSIRVDVGLLDKLMNLVGELVLARNQLLQGTSGQDVALIRTVQRLNVITSELQEGVLKTRMQPIGVVWNKLPRVIRDLASECGKKIQLDMEGAETELDKTIIEAIKDPLTHIVRNSCDHGIELPETRLQKGKSAEGLILLRAYHEGGHVIIEISDDGGGLDAEKLRKRALQKGLIRPDQAASMPDREAVQLVFLPGFSTAEHVTKISGRGVGMDVVKTNIQKIGGMVDIFNRAGTCGSTVKIKIPLTLAIIPGLVIKAVCGKSDKERHEGLNITPEETCQEHQFVIPQASLLELVRLEGEQGRQQVEYVNGAPVFRRRGQLLPLAYLSSVLGISQFVFPASDVVNIVVLQAEDRPFGLIVDGISDTQEIVVKPLGKRLKGLSSYLGSTIMGDGRVALILDVPGLARLAGIVAQSREMKKPDASLIESESDVKQTFLIFQAGEYKRLAVPLALVSRLEQFPRKSLEFASGRPVLYYRDQILPLLTLNKLLGTGQLQASNDSLTIQVIVFGEDKNRIGIVVDQIVDIIEATVTFTQSSTRPGLLGSAVVGGTITDLLDLQAVIECAGEGRQGHAPGTNTGARLLVVDPSSASRTMLCSYLNMQGYRIQESPSVKGALEQLETCALAEREIDLVLTSLTLDSDKRAQKISKDCQDLLNAIRTSRVFSDVPVIATIPHGLTRSLTHEGTQSAFKFDAVEPANERQILVNTIEKLIAQKKMQPAA